MAWAGLDPVKVSILGLLNLYGFYGDDFTVEGPTGDGKRMNLFEGPGISRAYRPFMRAREGRGRYTRLGESRATPLRDLTSYEYFHGATGRLGRHRRLDGLVAVPSTCLRVRPRTR